MKYILLSTIEEYNQLNQAVSIGRGYPHRTTNLYAPEIPETVSLQEAQPSRGTDGEIIVGDTTLVDVEYYKFPLSDDIMAVVIAIAGQTIYNEDGSKLFENA